MSRNARKSIISEWLNQSNRDSQSLKTHAAECISAFCLLTLMTLLGDLESCSLSLFINFSIFTVKHLESKQLINAKLKGMGLRRGWLWAFVIDAHNYFMDHSYAFFQTLACSRICLVFDSIHGLWHLRHVPLWMVPNQRTGPQTHPHHFSKLPK